MGLFLFLAGIAAIIGGLYIIEWAPTDIQTGIGIDAVLAGLILIGQSAILGRMKREKPKPTPDRTLTQADRIAP